MSIDIASLGIQLDTRQVVDGTKALDALGDTSAKVESKVESTAKALGNMGDASANVWRRGGEAAKGMDALGESTAKTGQRVAVSNGQMSDTAKILQQQAEQAKAAAAANTALGAASGQLTLGQQILRDRFADVAATVGMSRSQLMAYQAAQMGVTAETQKSIAAVKAHEEAIRAAAKAKEDAVQSANRLAEAIKLLAAGYALLKVGEYIKEATMLAARYETLGVVMEVVGKNAGYTKTQMEHASEGIAKQGITMIESRESAVKLVQAHVDLQHASELARIAQNAAVIGHMNSSEAFDRLVNGIARGNVLILRNIGINVNLQSAYREMADSLGKTTKELTENERVEARRIAVFERGADINGVYERSMDTAGKQILSMQRYTQDFKTTFGEVFNEALTIGVMGLTDNLKGANKSITDLSKNDQLEEWGHSLTRVFVGIVTAVSNAITAIQKVDAFARHMDARKDIGLKFDSQIADNFSSSKLTTLAGATDFYQKNKRIDAARQTALAEENAEYEARQAALSSNFGRFERAADEREKTRTAKHKADADERLKVDQKYAADAAGIRQAAAGKGEAEMAAAEKKVKALYQQVYVGTPDYRDTEGREPKPKVDQAENTRLADHLKRIDTEVAAEKAGAEYMMRIDEMRQKAGELGDGEFYDRRRGYIEEMAGAEIAGYNKQLAELRDHNNNTEAETAKNAKAIHDIEDKKKAAQVKFGYDTLLMDEQERLRLKATEAASDEASNKYISGLNAQIEAIEMANGKRSKSASAMVAETAAQTRAAAALMAIQAAGPTGDGHTQADVDAAAKKLVMLNLQADAQERLSAAMRDGEAAAASRKLADQAIGDWQRVGSSIADSLTNAFGTGGKAIGQMFKAYAEGQSAQLRAAKELALAKQKLDNDPEKVEAIRRSTLAGTQAQVKSYGDMADAAQGYFAEGSRGYEAIGAASKILHAAEFAMNIASIAPAMAAGAAQFFAQSGWGGFAGVAAMAAVIAGFGVAVSSGGAGGGGQSAADAQKAQGTGSVFGNSTAKSDSIARSIALSAENSDIELNYSAGMLASLQAIEASMSGLTNLIVRSGGITDGSNLGIKTGTLSTSKNSALNFIPVIGPVLSLLSSLWGKTTQNIVDSGIQLGGSVRDLQSGSGFQQYASVDTTKSSWFGLSKSTSNSVQTAGLSSELSSQFGLIFTNLETALKAAATGIGMGAGQVTAALDSLTIDTTKLSLKGLTGDDLTAAINGVISKTMDQMAEAAIPGLDKFRKVGEGYAETVIRIATDYAKIDGILGGIGMSFGAVGLGSIAAREHLIELAGGIEALASQTKGFAGNFLSQAEQLAPVQKYVTDQLAAMGLAGVQTRDDFKNVVLGLDLTQPAAQQTYASLMALQDAFAKTHAATVDLTKSEQEIADERADLQKQYDQLTMTSTQLRAKERLAITGSNLALFDQITQLQTIKDTSDALKTSIDKLKSFKDGILSFRDSLTLGSLSTLNPMQKAAEAQRQYEDMLANAKAGDAAAQAGIQGAATAYLTADQIVKASSDAYVNDAMKVQADLMALADAAGAQISVDQLQLTALDSQVTQLATLNTEVKGLREDNAKLLAALERQTGAVEEQTAAVVSVTLKAADSNADKVNKGTINAGQMRNYKLNLDAEAVAQ